MNARAQLTDAQRREQAAETLVDRLTSGKLVDGATSRNIFHDLADDASSHQYQTLLDILDGVLLLNSKCGDERVLACGELEDKAKGLIYGYVLGREDWLSAEIQNAVFEAKYE